MLAGKGNFKFGSKYTFEIFGYDFMVLQTESESKPFTVRMIEINTNPSIEESN